MGGWPGPSGGTERPREGRVIDPTGGPGWQPAHWSQDRKGRFPSFGEEYAGRIAAIPGAQPDSWDVPGSYGHTWGQEDEPYFQPDVVVEEEGVDTVFFEDEDEDEYDEYGYLTGGGDGGGAGGGDGFPDWILWAGGAAVGAVVLYKVATREKKEKPNGARRTNGR